MHISEQAFFDGLVSFVAVHHLTMHGTNFQIGHKLAELAIERYGQSPAHYAANPVCAKARRVYFQRNYPIHWERVRGVAAAFDLDPDDDRYDLTTLWYNLGVPASAPGCSVVYYPPTTTASGKRISQPQLRLLHGHNGRSDAYAAATRRQQPDVSGHERAIYHGMAS